MLLERNKTSACIIASIFLAGFILYSNILHAPFVFDDHPNILENTALRNLGDLSQIWERCSTRFLPYVTFAVNYHFFHNNTFSYHLVNVLIHCINSVLVFFLVKSLGETPFLKDFKATVNFQDIALTTVFIFLAHPLQTQAVTYVVQRITSLAAFWYLASVLLYIRLRLSFNRWVYWGAFVTTVCAMLTKEISFTLPFMLCLCEGMLFENKEGLKKRILRLVPFLATLVLIPLLLFWGLSSRGELAGMTRETHALTRQEYLLTQIHVLGTYLRLLFFPVGQNVVYDTQVVKTLLGLKTIALLFLIAGILGWAVKNRVRDRWRAFAVFWFFLTLSVESSFIPITDSLQEHRLYLPMFGFALLLSVSVFSWFQTRSRGRAFFFFLIALYAVLTFQRNTVWRSEEFLYADVLQKSPKNGFVYSQLGSVCLRKNDLAKAKNYFQTAVLLSPHPADYVNLSAIALRENNFEEAITFSRLAMSFKGWNSAPALNNLGNAYFRKGLLKKAKESYQQAILLDSGIIEARGNLADIFITEKELEKAAILYKEILDIDPGQKHIQSKLSIMSWR